MDKPERIGAAIPIRDAIIRDLIEYPVKIR
jgi:hypothetical protein